MFDLAHCPNRPSCLLCHSFRYCSAHRDMTLDKKTHQKKRIAKQDKEKKKGKKRPTGNLSRCFCICELFLSSVMKFVIIIHGDDD